jgi:hypothetical protein
LKTHTPQMIHIHNLFDILQVSLSFVYFQILYSACTQMYWVAISLSIHLYITGKTFFTLHKDIGWQKFACRTHWLCKSVKQRWAFLFQKKVVKKGLLITCTKPMLNNPESSKKSLIDWNLKKQNEKTIERRFFGHVFFLLLSTFYYVFIKKKIIDLKFSMSHIQKKNVMNKIKKIVRHTHAVFLRYMEVICFCWNII